MSTNHCLIREEGLWQLFRGMTSSSNWFRISWPRPCSHLCDWLTVSSWQSWRHLLYLALQKPWMDSFSLLTSANLQMDQMCILRGLRLLYYPVQGSDQCTWSTHSSCLGIWTTGWWIWMRRKNWRIPYNMPLHPNLTRFLCIQMQARPICFVLPPRGPITASLHPSRLQKTWGGSRMPKGKYFSLHSPCCWSACWHFSMLWDLGQHHYGLVKHGIKLDFCTQSICSNYTPRCSLTSEGANAVDAEIKLLLLKHVISPAKLKADSFVSSIFTTRNLIVLIKLFWILITWMEASLMCILKWNPWNMSGNLSNLVYGWGPLTSGMHITVFVWILPSSSILQAICRGTTMSFYVCLMGMLRHHSYSPSSHLVSFGNMVMLQLSK